MCNNAIYFLDNKEDAIRYCAPNSVNKIRINLKDLNKQPVEINEENNQSNDWETNMMMIGEHQVIVSSSVDVCSTMQDNKDLEEVHYDLDYMNQGENVQDSIDLGTIISNVDDPEEIQAAIVVPTETTTCFADIVADIFEEPAVPQVADEVSVLATIDTMTVTTASSVTGETRSKYQSFFY